MIVFCLVLCLVGEGSENNMIIQGKIFFNVDVLEDFDIHIGQYMYIQVQNPLHLQL